METADIIYSIYLVPGSGFARHTETNNLHSVVKKLKELEGVLSEVNDTRLCMLQEWSCPFDDPTLYAQVEVNDETFDAAVTAIEEVGLEVSGVESETSRAIEIAEKRGWAIL